MRRLLCQHTLSEPNSPPFACDKGKLCFTVVADLPASELGCLSKAAVERASTSAPLQNSDGRGYRKGRTSKRFTAEEELCEWSRVQKSGLGGCGCFISGSKAPPCPLPLRSTRISPLQDNEHASGEVVNVMDRRGTSPGPAKCHIPPRRRVKRRVLSAPVSTSFDLQVPLLV